MQGANILFLFSSSIDTRCCDGELTVEIVIERLQHLQLFFSVDFLQSVTTKLSLGQQRALEGWKIYTYM